MQNSGSAPPVDINSPGEPRFVTFYQALESASIRNENLDKDNVSQQQKLTGGVTKVDSNATVSNGVNNDIANNNDTASPTASIATTSFPETTVDTTIAGQSANISLTSRLGTGNIGDSSASTTQTPGNSDPSGKTTLSSINATGTTPISTSESPGITTSNNTIMNTPANIPSFPTKLTTTETIEASTLVDASSTTLPSTENTTVFSSTSESVTVMQVSPEVTTMSAINNTSENIETNTEGSTTQPSTTLSQVANMNNTDENVETNTIQQSDATAVPEMTTEITSTTETTTTEEISNDIFEFHVTQLPVITTTFKTQLSGFAQDVLTRFQENLSTVKSFVEEPTTTVSSELSNTIPDSSSTNVESSTTEDVETTTVGRESTNTSTIIGSDNRDSSSSSTTAEQELSSTADERNATLDSDLTTTTQNVSSLGDSDAENATITSTPSPQQFPTDFIMEDKSRSFNDTLLAELMTIAKTLFSEVMNETRYEQSSNQISDIETATIPSANNSIQADGSIENRLSSNDTSETTAASPEFSTLLENTSESIDSTTPVNSPESSGEISTRGPVKSEIPLTEVNTRPTDVQNPVDVGDIAATPKIFSQIKIETLKAVTPVTASMNSELTTNMPDLQLSNTIQPSNNNNITKNSIKQQTLSIVDSAQQTQFTTVSNNDAGLSEFTINLATNNPFVTNSVIANVEGMLYDVNKSTTLSVETIMELTTSVIITEINVVQTNAVDTTKTLEFTTIQSDLINLSSTTTTVLDDNVTDTSGTQPLITEPFTTESVRNPLSSTDTITTNQFNDLTTNAPQMMSDFISNMPNLIARFQDTTATAQRTAGSGIVQPQQTTETITTVPTVTISSTDSSSESSTIDTTTTSSPSAESTIATATTTETTTTMTTTSQTTEPSSQVDLTTTSTQTTTSTVDINENLVPTETSTDTSTMRDTTVAPNESVDLNMISRMDVEEEMTTSAASSTSMPTTTTTTTTQTNTNQMTTRPSFTSGNTFNTGSVAGRFGGGQMTPVPGLGSSSKAPARDYLVYGVYPNKTIVRKRPEDNLIDARNVNSPYVIFGIFPDGRLVRKFPNGTIIPESSRNPVEVVFTLSTTTTTNRPVPRPYYNQANQVGFYNQYQAPVYYNNRRPVDELTGGVLSPSPVDFGLIGNAIGVPFGGGPNFAGPFGLPASVPSTNKMVSLSNFFINIIFYP